jgi:hypothetical protein
MLRSIVECKNAIAGTAQAQTFGQGMERQPGIARRSA